MGRLAGHSYRRIVKKYKTLGFELDRQAAGSHEIWYNPDTDRYTTVPIIPEICPKVPCGQSSSRRV